MLLEAIFFSITPCPPTARRLGFLKENISIISRYGRCKNKWLNHLSESKKTIEKAIEKYDALAAKRNMSLTDLALSFVYSQWFVTSTVIGATNMNQLKQNIAAYGLNIVNEELIQEIDAIHLDAMNPAP